MGDKWKVIDKFDGYEINKYGTVRTLDRVVTYSNGTTKNFHSTVLPNIIRGGRTAVRLYKNDLPRVIFVEDLIIKYF